MCLYKIKKSYPNNDKMVMAYKIYRKTPKRYIERYRHGIRKEGKYYKAEGGMSHTGYELGFHAYTNLKVAKLICRNINIHIYNYRICKVLLWDISAIGSEYEYNYGNVIVGRNIRIMEEIDLN